MSEIIIIITYIILMPILIGAEVYIYAMTKGSIYELHTED